MKNAILHILLFILPFCSFGTSLSNNCLCGCRIEYYTMQVCASGTTILGPYNQPYVPPHNSQPTSNFNTESATPGSQGRNTGFPSSSSSTFDSSNNQFGGPSGSTSTNQGGSDQPTGNGNTGGYLPGTLGAIAGFSTPPPSTNQIYPSNNQFGGQSRSTSTNGGPFIPQTSNDNTGNFMPGSRGQNTRFTPTTPSSFNPGNGPSSGQPGSTSFNQGGSNLQNGNVNNGGLMTGSPGQHTGFPTSPSSSFHPGNGPSSGQSGSTSFNQDGSNLQNGNVNNGGLMTGSPGQNTGFPTSPSSSFNPVNDPFGSQFESTSTNQGGSIQQAGNVNNGGLMTGSPGQNTGLPSSVNHRKPCARCMKNSRTVNHNSERPPMVLGCAATNSCRPVPSDAAIGNQPTTVNSVNINNPPPEFNYPGLGGSSQAPQQSSIGGNQKIDQPIYPAIRSPNTMSLSSTPDKMFQRINEFESTQSPTIFQLTSEDNGNLAFANNDHLRNGNVDAERFIAPFSGNPPQLASQHFLSHQLHQSRMGQYISNLAEEVHSNKFGYDTTSSQQEVTESSSTDSPITELQIKSNFSRNQLYEDCGQYLTTAYRIYNGRNTQLGEFPSMARLEYHTPNKNIKLSCGGTLISRTFVLTAAHCVRLQDKSLSLVAVRLGDYDTSTDPDCFTLDSGEEMCADPSVLYGIDEVIVHENFNGKPFDPYDIALIRLSMEVTYTDYIKPICLPEANSTIDSELVAIGWGNVNSTSSMSDVLQKVSLPLVDRKTCEKSLSSTSWQPLHKSVAKSQICAGGEKNKDTCLGDSGGPLMQMNDWSRNSTRWEVVAITSHGPLICGQPNKPGIYTNVIYFLDWITKKMDLE